MRLAMRISIKDTEMLIAAIDTGFLLAYGLHAVATESAVNVANQQVILGVTRTMTLCFPIDGQLALGAFEHLRRDDRWHSTWDDFLVRMSDALDRAILLQNPLLLTDNECADIGDIFEVHMDRASCP